MDDERNGVDVQGLAAVDLGLDGVLGPELGSAYAALCEELHHSVAQTVQQVVRAALARAQHRQRVAAIALSAAPAAPPLADSPSAQRTHHGARRVDAAAMAMAVRDSSEARLSEREREVLQLLAAGESNKLIARALGLSPHTVKRHVANILDKLDVRTRGQAAALVLARH